MTSITRFNPFNELARMDPFGDEFFKGFALRPVYGSSDTAPQMRLDVTEDEKAYTVKAEIPGVNKEDIKVAVDGNLVSISAEVKKDKEEKKDGRVLRSERQYGYASRSLWLDQPVDQAKSIAKYENGVLELTLPKKATSTSKRLTIS